MVKAARAHLCIAILFIYFLFFLFKMSDQHIKEKKTLKNTLCVQA